MKLLTLALAALVSCVSATLASDCDHGAVGATHPVDAPVVPSPPPTPIKRMTNADRLRRGLPPLPPTRRSHHNLAPRASVLPWSDTGKIAVRRADNNALVGYIRHTGNSAGMHTIGSLAEALTVTIHAPYNNHGGLRYISEPNGPSSTYTYFGAMGGPNSRHNLTPGNLAYAFLGPTIWTAPNATPAYGTNVNIIQTSSRPTESTVFWVDTTTGAMKAQWVNPDGTKYPAQTQFFFNPVVNYVGIIVDLAKFHESLPNENAYAVTLTFVPNTWL